MFHTAVQSENGGSGVCCSSAVKGLQRCRERHAELPERSTFTRPRVYSAVAPGSTHTQDTDAGCKLSVKKNIHCFLVTHDHSTSGPAFTTTESCHTSQASWLGQQKTAKRHKIQSFSCCRNKFPLCHQQLGRNIYTTYCSGCWTLLLSVKKTAKHKRKSASVQVWGMMIEGRGNSVKVAKKCK